ncbi:hypothetical protein NE237_029580 [Protea cynaroides]|uniref:adenylate dimethylallyltransferase (ADP/ATP-dependent) n=1 Tax=Protea cynaroides TaxID=273540 RepID=A0A9Q0GU59_9MAGN|nr:hypothetical protein NE237_029580 [Protea cynaroides]
MAFSKVQAPLVSSFAKFLASSDLYPKNHKKQKEKVIFVMGSTGTGKSKLAIHLATKFHGEVINSDKIQVHKGLDTVTNKVTHEEMSGVPHHLLAILDPDAEFTMSDFCEKTSVIMRSILDQGKIPIIAGGSNRYIEALVENETFEFKKKYDLCTLWVHVSLPVLKKFVYERVDQMIEAGLVDEVRSIFKLDGDYSKGIRRSIGVPELDAYFRAEAEGYEDKKKTAILLEQGISMIKSNTYDLACCQYEKIKKLKFDKGWNIHIIDATEVFLKCGIQREQEWQGRVAGPTMKIVSSFLYGANIS